MTIKPGEDPEVEYIPADKVLHLFKHSNLSICAETEERIHGENVITDFNITESDWSEQDVQDMIDEGFYFFID